VKDTILTMASAKLGRSALMPDRVYYYIEHLEGRMGKRASEKLTENI
jgi:hypothetical protein